MASSIVRFDPFEDLGRLQREMNRLFEESQPRDLPRKNGAPSLWAPQVDIHEDENVITVKADLPGVKLEDIDIQLTNDTLTVTGERRFQDEERKSGYVRVERAYGSFKRTFTLGVPVDADKIKASFKDGVLTISLPKSDEIKPKKVQVSAE